MSRIIIKSTLKVKDNSNCHLNGVNNLNQMQLQLMVMLQQKLKGLVIMNFVC